MTVAAAMPRWFFSLVQMGLYLLLAYRGWKQAGEVIEQRHEGLFNILHLRRVRPIVKAAGGLHG